ncbi:MAG: 50S ribosomal protein L10 [Candidatus Bathyarchaeota archaeon]|nr:MAG: 50S ribosomal protein L10 [Candidatus Bathyarchaeota archaeon]
MTEQRQVLQEKTKEIEEIGKTMQRYKVIALASLQKVRAAQLQELRKKLRSDAYLLVIKNSLMKRAIAKSKDKPDLDKLEAHLIGATIYLFTDLNPFKLVLLLEKSKVLTTAKSGDIAAFDVVVPAGNTGQPPGPIISQLGAVGLKTRIESGSVWINKDTLVAKKGEVISQRLAPILSKLGIKPVEAGLELKTVYDEGRIITEEQLRIDLNQIREDVKKAHKTAFYLSINSAYTTPENIGFLLQKAYQDAYRLSVNENIPTKDTIVDILRKANMQVLSLKAQLDKHEKKAEGKVEEKTEDKKTEKKSEQKTEKEEKKTEKKTEKG